MSLPNGITECKDGKNRCWYADSDVYFKYHDTEWGVPNDDDRWLYEKICLEGFQSGLSWATILNKRENFRAAFDNFDFYKVAEYGEGDVQRLLGNAGIVRHKRKIESTINNAKRAIELKEEYGSLAGFIWQFEPPEESRPEVITKEVLMKLTKTPESEAMSKELKKKGWSFIGPTNMYAFMQSIGMVNDHVEGCVFRNRCTQLRRSFVRPRKL